ncbi:MAG: polysulfide reductase NrfD [Lewinellaceae bacterium]|nr:polysulfide reductase NrfD [Saprospiraceae bacterium]MCB9340777.1 polysulfide reductase NrfD [Lewinellaceae bacterium]
MKYGFIIDNRKCIGCHACTTACKSEHDVPVGVFRTFVKQVEKGEFPNTRRVFSVMRCNHCTDAPCVEICPVEALYFRPDGIVDFDKNRCIGCKSCMQACPYDALYIDPDTHTAAKCNYCAHRIDIGLEPACVNICPEHAIISGDMDNPNSEISELLARETVTVRKAAKGTHPNLFYIDGDESSLNPIATEKKDYTLWGAQTRGVGHFAHQTEKLAFSGGDIVTAAMSNNGSSTSNAELQNTNNGLKSIDVKMGDARRVYDAPNKGILWGWEVSGYVWTKAISTGAFLVPFIGWLFQKQLGLDSLALIGMLAFGVIVALIFLVATGALLVKDLDQPKRFVYVLLRPQWKSWLVKGGYSITAFGGFLTLLLVSSIFQWESVAAVSLFLSAAAAVLTAVYTAFLFAQAKGRDFWQSPALALHMMVHSIMAGAAVFALIGFFSGLPTNWNMFLTNTLYVTLGLNLLTMLVELTMTHPTEDAKLVVNMITKGRYSSLFWWGALMVGNLIPLGTLLSGATFALPMAGLLVLIGIYITEKIWVEAPQRIQLS